jgi:A/G-specific adenine glycosylase
LNGRLPRSSAELHTLPGVGDYTAAAIASIAFGESIAVLDGNVERVLLRILGWPEERTSKVRTRLVKVAQLLMPAAAKRAARSNPPGNHNQAMMELGATICLPRGPLCLQCPVVGFCKTRGEHKTQVREKQQSRIVAHLLSMRKRGTTTEVLLERRASNAALMPSMLELPPLPLAAVQGREPVLRLRHSITNTNYYVQIFAESAAGVDPRSQYGNALAPGANGVATEEEDGETFERAAVDEELFVADPDKAKAELSLLDEVPAAVADLEWVSASNLRRLPLTGLARKALQRLGVMPMPKIKLEE